MRRQAAVLHLLMQLRPCRSGGGGVQPLWRTRQATGGLQPPSATGDGPHWCQSPFLARTHRQAASRGSSELLGRCACNGPPLLPRAALVAAWDIMGRWLLTEP